MTSGAGADTAATGSTRVRRLIVNADDFGRSPERNAGVRKAHEQGIVTSASLMVCWPAAQAAASYARGRRGLSLGLHADLADWEFRGAAWRAVYQRVALDDPGPIQAELRRQLERFRELTGADPTHLDAHQHVHREDRARDVFLRFAQELGIPLRDHSAARYCGDFYGQTGRGDPLPDLISVAGLIAIIEGLPPGDTELGCHPGLGLDEDDVYAREAAIEAETLCDPLVREALGREGVELISFGEL